MDKFNFETERAQYYSGGNFRSIWDNLENFKGEVDLIAHMAKDRVNVLSIDTKQEFLGNDEYRRVYIVTIEFQYTQYSGDGTERQPLRYMKPMWRRFTYTWDRKVLSWYPVVAYGYKLALEAREILESPIAELRKAELEED